MSPASVAPSVIALSAASATAESLPATVASRRRSSPRRTGSVSAGLTPTLVRRVGEMPDQARRQAAVILDVLGGNRTPTAAAQALGLSVARYYAIEQRAMLGLVEACSVTPPRGPTPDHDRRLRALEQENRRLQQAVLRQQAIVRNTQRGLGLGIAKPPAPTTTTTGKSRKPRRPSVRALRQARRIAPVASDVTTAPTADSVSGDHRGG